MYHLLVSSNDESWNGEPFLLEEDRCLQEYTAQEITAKYGDFTQQQINEIKRFPCIFAYEKSCKKDPKFGLIKNITKRQKKVKIEYEIIPLEIFLSHTDIFDMLFDLDISKWEMNRTHWALIDINLSKELAPKGIQLPQWARSQTKSVDITKHQFDVALSFPGEIRDYIEQVAEALERLIGPDSYFYDNNYLSQLARPSLDTLLQDIYLKRSKLVVVFLCKKYEEKQWCGIGFRAIREIIMAKEHEKVMFVKMDDGEVKGVFNTDGYIDGSIYSLTDVAGFIEERSRLLI